jgi:hypothetical protein
MNMNALQAAVIVDSLLYELSDRRGFDIGDLDPETRMEIREAWIQLVLDGGNGMRPWWVEDAKEKT